MILLKMKMKYCRPLDEPHGGTLKGVPAAPAAPPADSGPPVPLSWLRRPPEDLSSQVRPSRAVLQEVAECLLLVTTLRAGWVILLADPMPVSGQQCRVAGAQPCRLDAVSAWEAESFPRDCSSWADFLEVAGLLDPLPPPFLPVHASEAWPSLIGGLLGLHLGPGPQSRGPGHFRATVSEI